jgi:hypothetical protein
VSPSGRRCSADGRAEPPRARRDTRPGAHPGGDRERYTSLAVGASNGGLFGLQRGYATPFGRFQFDRPYGVRVEDPFDAAVPPLRSVKWIGLRMSFDWRHYF